jgi:hypothetical protein
MIKFVTGKPGGGKSLRVVKIILEYLMTTDKILVTNVPLRLDNIQEYMMRRGNSSNPYGRVVMLRKEEFPGRVKQMDYLDILRTFYLYRTPDLKPQHKPAQDDKGKYTEELEFEPDTFGRVFVIDEIHKLWNARDFQKQDKLIFEYLAEHRHFSDEVVFITQALAQVDKQIRLLGQDFEVIRNRGKEKFYMFAGPKKFDRFVYLQAPTGATNSVHSEKSSFTLDIEEADCYFTSAKGGEADKGQKAKGLPWWTIYAGLAAFIALAWVVLAKLPMVLMKKGAFDKGFADTEEIVSPGAGGESPPDRAEPVGKQRAELVESQIALAKSLPGPSEVRQSLEIVGGYIMQSGGKFWLSDGRVLSTRDERITSYRDDGIVFDGSFIPWAQPGRAGNAPREFD